jgi:transketolase
MRKGSDATIIACGIQVSESLRAAEILKKENIDVQVVNMHTIKPIDKACIIDSAKKTGAIVTAEEHQIHGGLGSAVAEVVVRNCPVPMAMVAVDDQFGESGTPEELLQAYHLKDIDIAQAVRNVIRRKTDSIRVSSTRARRS